MGEGSSRGGSFVLRNNGWIDIEMVKTLSRPLSQQQNPNRVGPIRKPGLDLLEKDEVKTKRPSMWNIVLYNDDYTPMDDRSHSGAPEGKSGAV
jgi:hypothetical protein